MEKKLPDSYVPDRYSKSYPTEIGSQPFEPDNIELFKLDKSNRLKHHYTQRFNEIKSQYEDLMNSINLNERIYKSKYNFQPIVGNNYYLYSNGEYEFLSIISPEEWKNKYVFIGKYQLLTDGMWLQIND